MKKLVISLLLFISLIANLHGRTSMQTSSGNEDDCPCEEYFQVKNNSDCNKDKKYFGEDTAFYSDNTIVYVYDFNKDPSKRIFYKITKKGGKLDRQMVNLDEETLTPGDHVRFKVYNVNKFMYDVSIGDKIVQYNSEIPLLFGRYFLGDNTSLGTLMGALSSAPSNKSSQQNILQSLSSRLNCFVKIMNCLRNDVVKVYDPCTEFDCCRSYDYDKIANLLAKIRLDAFKIQQELEEQKEIISQCDKSKKAEAKLQSEIKELEKDKEKNKEAIKSKTDELAKINEDLKKKCGENDEIKKRAEAVLTEFTAINNLIENLPTDDDLKRIIVFLNNAIWQNSMHTSDFIPLNGNLLELTLNISSKDSIRKLFNIPEYKNQILIQIPITCKPFVSFSSGSFVAIGNTLQNKTYAWQETTGNNNTANDLNYTLVESGYTSMPSGFCALGSLEWKTSRSLGFGVSVGVGLTIEKSPRLAYLAGISCFFGDLRQFAFTGGLVGMQVSKLTNNFQTITDNQIIYKSKPEIQYYNESKFGAFISLTYTPFTTK